MRRALSAATGKLRSGGEPKAAAILEAAMRAAQNDDGRHDVHGFHTYAARLSPATAARLLAPIDRGSVVLDPFCGSGTTLIEANRRGLAARGVDANPLAVRLATLRTTFRAPDEIAALVAAAETVSEASATRARTRARTMSSGDKYDDKSFYDVHVFRELVGLREEIGKVRSKPLREALLLVLSAIVVKFSKRVPDVKPGDATTKPAASTAKKIAAKAAAIGDDDVPDDDAADGNDNDDDDTRDPDDRPQPAHARQIGRGIPSRFFFRKAEELGRALASFNRTRGSRDVEIRVGDARRLSHIGNGAIDCVLTSPPYFGTYDYVEHHARRYGWLGIDPAEFERKEIGARRRASEKDWSQAVSAYAKELARVTKRGAPILIVSGDSTVAGRHVPGDQQIRQAAPTAGLGVVAWATEERAQFEATSKRRVRLEHVLLLTHI